MIYENLIFAENGMIFSSDTIRKLRRILSAISDNLCTNYLGRYISRARQLMTIMTMADVAERRQVLGPL